MAAAQETAQMNRLERRGVGDQDLIARVAQRQEMAQARERLAVDAEGAQLDSARMGIDTNREVDATRLALARSGRGEAEFGLEAQGRTRDRRMTLEERTLDNSIAQTDVESRAAATRMQQLELEQATLADQIANAPEDLDLRRQLERSQVEAARLQNQLTARQAQTGIEAEAATAPVRVETAQATGEAQRDQAKIAAIEQKQALKEVQEGSVQRNQLGNLFDITTEDGVAQAYKATTGVAQDLFDLRNKKAGSTTLARLKEIEQTLRTQAIKFSQDPRKQAAYTQAVKAELERVFGTDPVQSDFSDTWRGFLGQLVGTDRTADGRRPVSSIATALTLPSSDVRDAERTFESIRRLMGASE